MNRPRVVYHMVRADFLERTRRPSFFITLGFAVYLGYLVNAGLVTLQLDHWHGQPNSAWHGAVIALVGSVFLPLVGFYIVKNTIQRDRETRVGRILAATPMSRAFYTLSKALSNFAVLASMVVVLAIAALILQWTHPGNGATRYTDLLVPLFVFPLTSLAITAALAVLFETLPGLRGGLGNVLYFFLWIFLLSLSVGSLVHNKPLSTFSYLHDYTGITTISGDMQAQVRLLDPTYAGGSSFSIGGLHQATQTFLWPGLHWSTAILLSRVLWILAAITLTFLAALFFDRFDPARELPLLLRKSKQQAATVLTDPAYTLSSRPEAALFAAVAEGPAALLAPAMQSGPFQPQPLTQISATTLTPIPNRNPTPRILALIQAELRLLLRGQRWWWHTIALGLNLACLFSPLEVAQNLILAAWLWPALLWSQLGSRETRFHTEALIFSAPRAFPRQLLAVYAAGAAVTVLTGTGLALHLLFTGHLTALAAWLTAALFIPALALALGVLTQSRKPFEALYVVLWYIGPLHHLHTLDFIGTTPASTNTPLYLIAAAALLACTLLFRKVQLSRT